MRTSFFAALAAMLLLSPQSKAQVNINDSVKYVTGANAEYASILNYMKRAMRFNAQVPQEKVYLHFDNTGYYKGETIWFKAYVVNAGDQTPTNISTVLYVELVTPGGDVIKTKKLYIKDGEAEGDIKLEKIYKTGFYEVRAYTRYMTNWGNAAIFSRVFPVYEEPKKDGDYSKSVMETHSYKYRMPEYREIPEEMLDEKNNKKGKNDNIVTAKKLPKGKINVSFYPEGGALVENVPCRIAFNVVDSEGRHFDTEGTILNSKKEVVGAAITFEKGRGFVDVLSDGEPLYLRLKTADGKEQEFLLPEADPEGVGLVMNTLRDDAITARLSASRSLQGRLLGYVLMNKGKIAYADTLTTKSSMSIKIDRHSAPEGVNQLVLFDSDGKVLADRLFFICPTADQSDSIYVTTKQKVIQPCGKVKLNIQTRPNASVSLSAMDISTMTDGCEGNAKTWMLLSSEVKGYIEHPDYYFESDDLAHRRAADMLMMVQGWRRHRWQLMDGDEKFRTIQHIEDSLYISGKVLDNKGKRVKAGIDLDIVFYNKLGDWLRGSTVTDSNGEYAFAAPNMSGDWNVQFITKENGVKKKMRVTVDRHFSPMRRWLSPYETDEQAMYIENFMENTPDSLFKDFDDIPLRKRENMLPNVKVKARRRIFEGARAAWESEARGEYGAWIYYDMIAETQKIQDEGKTIPGIFDWLLSRNPNFAARGVEQYFPTHEESNNTNNEDNNVVADYGTDDSNNDNADIAHEASAIGDDDGDITINELEEITKGNKSSGHSDKLVSKEEKKRKETSSSDCGLDYKNRPILWVINNKPFGITSSLSDDMFVLREESLYSIQRFPLYIDEVNAIYISEDAKSYQQYGLSRLISSSAKKPVTIHIYTHVDNFVKVKGQVSTRYHAFDSVDTFEMDDYSVLPPMEDYRRTLYWAPNVKTDKDGKATVEFFNNSSARKFYISAEGMTKDGHILVNE